jgi:glutaredoxin-related protein
MFCRLLFVLFLLAIVLSALLRPTDSDYLFGIVKLFLEEFEDTKQVIRMSDRQEEFENTKQVIRMSDRQEEIEDTKQVIRMSDRHEEFEDTKQVIRMSDRPTDSDYLFGIVKLFLTV